VRRGHDPAVLFGHQGDALAHPRVHDGLVWPAFQRAEHGVHRYAHPGYHRLGVSVDKPGELLAVVAAERPHLDI
jgi:hypothetical protein